MQIIQNNHHIDGIIFKLRKKQMNWKDIVQYIKTEHNTLLTVEDIIKRFQEMTKPLTPQQVQLIFHQFQQCNINYREISSRTLINVFQVKQQILAALANNISRVCLIVRKRKISSLQSNFISNNKIKELVLNMLKAHNFPRVKKEYSTLWNFICRHYPDNHYQTVQNQHYMLIYRELIILAESFKINQEQTREVAADSFEKKIIQVNNESVNRINSILQMSKTKKRSQIQAINLVSDDQQDHNSMQVEEEMSDHLFESEVKLDAEVRQPLIDWDTIRLRQLIMAHHNIREVEDQLLFDPFNEELRMKHLQKIVALGCLKLLCSQMDD